MKWAGDNIIDHMLDTIRDWKTQSQQWEQTAKQLADSLKTEPCTPKQQEALTNYTRQTRRKYRNKK